MERLWRKRHRKWIDYTDFKLLKHMQLKGITSSTRTRRGGSFLKDIYIRAFSSIELACAVRQPSPCVRALCETGVLFPMSHLKLHFTLHTWQSSHSTLHTSHCTLHTALFSHFTPHTLHTSRCTLRTPHFTLHTAHFTVHTSHCTLRTPNVTLHSPHFTLHTSHCTLLAPHFTLHPFISSEFFFSRTFFLQKFGQWRSSSHLIPAQLFSSHLFSCVI